MKAIAAVKKFFEGASKPLTLGEFKALSAEERDELGALACKELGVPFEIGSALEAMSKK